MLAGSGGIDSLSDCSGFFIINENSLCDVVLLVQLSSNTLRLRVCVMGWWSAAREQKIQYIYNVNEKECEFNERERNGMSNTCEDGECS
jgi:hypothetical protein